MNQGGPHGRVESAGASAVAGGAYPRARPLGAAEDLRPWLYVPELRGCSHPECYELVPTDARGWPIGWTVLGGEDLLFCCPECALSFDELKRPLP